MDFYNDDFPINKISAGIETLGIPNMPHIPEIVLCLHFPGTEGWNNHWIEFNKRVKEFRQAMIDFNWKILEWYHLKSRQLERFGNKTSYIAGTLLTGPRTTLIYTQAITGIDVMSEIRKCLPSAVEEDIRQLERTGYKLCLTGKIFVFNDERIVIIDYDKESDKRSYQNYLKFSLYHKNVKVNITESYKRIYGGIRNSFLIGGIDTFLGGLLASYLTGYFEQPSILVRKCCPEKNLLWYSISRFITSAACYCLVERVMLLKFTSPETYILSGSTGVICGAFFGFCDNCKPDMVLLAASEFGIFSFLCNLFVRKQSRKCCMVGGYNKN